MLKRQPSRSKSKRVIIDTSDEYDQQAAALTKTSYAIYEEAKKAVDNWQELAGQLTHIDKAVFPGKRPKRGSQPEAVTIICKSATECPFRCSIELLADKRYHIVFIDTAHTCRTGTTPDVDQEEPDSSEIKIPQALKQHVLSHQSPPPAKRHQSIKVWRKNVASSSPPSLPLSEQTSWPQVPDLRQSTNNEAPIQEKHKSKGASRIRDTMQPRPRTSKDQNTKEPDARVGTNSKASKQHDSITRTTQPGNEAVQQTPMLQKLPVAQPKAVPAVKTQTKLDRTVGSASRLAGFHNVPADTPGFIRRSELPAAASQQTAAPRPTLRPNNEYQRPIASAQQPTSSSKNRITPAKTVQKPVLPPISSLLPVGTPTDPIPSRTTGPSAPVPQPSAKRVTDDDDAERAKVAHVPDTELPAAKRHRKAAPAEINLADKEYGLDPHLVEFLATAGVQYLSDILNLGMMEADMDAFLSGVYKKMEGFAGTGQKDAERVRAAVKNCAEAITIAKVKCLFRL